MLIRHGHIVSGAISTLQKKIEKTPWLKEFRERLHIIMLLYPHFKKFAIYIFIWLL